MIGTIREKVLKIKTVSMHNTAKITNCVYIIYTTRSDFLNGLGESSFSFWKYYILTLYFNLIFASKQNDCYI